MDERLDEVDEDEGDSAATAFDNLRTEVAALRESIDAFPAAVRSNRPPDYAPTLAATVKAIQGVEKHLAIIERHPSIKLTPEQHGRAIEEAGAATLREAMTTFRNEAAALGLERRQLSQIIGAALDQEDQRRRQRWFGGAGAVLGLTLFPLISAFAPGGSHLAALAVGETDRWAAGTALMREGNPEAWQKIFDAGLVRSTPQKHPSDILAEDEKSLERKPEVGTVPTLPGACPILGDCALPGDELRSKKLRPRAH